MTVSGGGAPVCLQRFAVALYKNLAAVGGECGGEEHGLQTVGFPSSALSLGPWAIG